MNESFGRNKGIGDKIIKKSVARKETYTDKAATAQGVARANEVKYKETTEITQEPERLNKDLKIKENASGMLVRNLEIEDEVWGHKFSDRASGYSARIEDVEYDEKAETEIILDTSGSVSVILKKFFKTG